MPFFVISWVVLIGSTLWKPQKFRNSIFLMNALFFTVFFIAALAGEHMGTVLLIAFLLAFLALLLVPMRLIINGIVMMKKEVKSLGNLLSLLLGLVIGVGEIAYFVGFALEIRSVNPEYTVAKLIAMFIGSSVLYISFWILAFVLYMIFIQFHTAVQCRLTAEREQDSLRTLLGNDFFHKERRHRKEVDLVCDSFRCLDRGNVRVDQDGLNAFFAQSLERL